MTFTYKISNQNFVLFSIPPYFQNRSTQNDIPKQRWSLSSTSSYNPPTIPFPFAFHSTILILLVRHSYHNRIARLPSVFRLVGGKRNRHVAYRSERIPHWESVYPNFACRFRKEIFQIYVKTWIVVHDVSTIVPYFFRTTPPSPPPLASILVVVSQQFLVPSVLPPHEFQSREWIIIFQKEWPFLFRERKFRCYFYNFYGVKTFLS